jgi:hypothetical protein
MDSRDSYGTRYFNNPLRGRLGSQAGRRREGLGPDGMKRPKQVYGKNRQSKEK